MGVSGSSSLPRCVAATESPNENESCVYINSIRIHENGGKPISTFRLHPTCQTITSVFDSCCSMFSANSCFGEREICPDGDYGGYKWITYHQFHEICLMFAAGLARRGVKRGDRVGICSRTCLQWQISFIGLLYIGAIPVTVYESFGVEASTFIVNQARCKAIIVHADNLSNAKQFLEKIDNQDIMKILIGVKNVSGFILLNDIIRSGRNYKYKFQLFDEPENDEGKNNIILSFFNPIRHNDSSSSSDFENEEEDFSTEPIIIDFEPKPDDVALIMYTSGTTNKPKGCILTHRNIVAGATGLGSAGTSINTKDTYFSYLPLAHIYETCCHLVMLAHGVRIGFFSGDVRDIFKDCKVLQPTIICGVPRIFNKFIELVNTRLDEMHPILRNLTQWAIEFKEKQLHENSSFSMFLDYILFSQFKEELGGRLRFVVIGGAPILPEVYSLLKATLTPNIIQGYGLTEISAGGCVSDVNDSNPASVGPVSISVDMKLRRVPGMYYDPNDPQPSGELMFRGPTVFKGYLEDNNLDNPEDGFNSDELEQNYLEDGWFATGDIGMINKEGCVQIIDRVKQLVKLSHGEYISLSHLSEQYQTSPSVKKIFVYADSHHSQPVAVVVPTDGCIDSWVGRGITAFQSSEIARLELLKELHETSKKLKMRGFERILNIILVNDISDDLTPTYKIHVNELRAKYEASLLELYNKTNTDTYE